MSWDWKAYKIYENDVAIGIFEGKTPYDAFKDCMKETSGIIDDDEVMDLWNLDNFTLDEVQYKTDDCTCCMGCMNCLDITY